VGSEEFARRVPVEGYPTEVRVDGQTRWLWWGPDETGQDCVASAAGRVLSWESELDCLAAAGSNGWQHAAQERHGAARESERRPLDLAPAQRWLAGELRRVPHESALSLWNLGTDVAYSLGIDRHDRNRLADRCYDKLFAMTLPWLFVPTKTPGRWSGQELRQLRRQLDEAVHVLRIGLAGKRQDAGS
jgi:hypothetical protein